MVLACVVRNCDSKWYTRCPIIFQSSPKSPERRKLWLNLIELKSQYYECAKVCSKHFLESDYLNGKRLKIDACPSLYLARPSATSTSSAIVQDTAPTSILQPIDSNIIAVRTSPRKRKYHQEILEPKARPSAPSTSSAIVQDKLKSDREHLLLKQRKILAQKVARQNKSINNLKSLLSIVKDYTNKSEIENIITGRFSTICTQFKTASKNPHAVRYTEDAFALTLHFYSPKAYEFLKKYISLPSVETLRRSLVTFDCNVGFLSEVIAYLKAEVDKPDKYYLKNVA